MFCCQNYEKNPGDVSIFIEQKLSAMAGTADG
jgi:hypothetical protein